MKRSEAFPSKYVSKDDVKPPKRVTVSGVVKEVVGKEDEKTEENIMYFSDFDKPMFLNMTNWMILEDAYGDESDDWVGKSIELFCDPAVMFGGKRVGGVRVRILQDGQPTKPTNPLGITGQGVSVPSANGSKDARAELNALAKENKELYPTITRLLKDSHNDFAFALKEVKAMLGDGLEESPF